MARHPTRQMRETELGTEVQCAKCEEFWPADPEFFYFGRRGPHSWCKACYLGSDCFHAKRERWLAKQRATRCHPRLPAPIVPQAPVHLSPIELPREPWPRLVAQLRAYAPPVPCVHQVHVHLADMGASA
jgi:hypothetical protein